MPGAAKQQVARCSHGQRADGFQRCHAATRAAGPILQVGLQDACPCGEWKRQLPLRTPSAPCSTVACTTFRRSGSSGKPFTTSPAAVQGGRLDLHLPAVRFEPDLSGEIGLHRRNGKTPPAGRYPPQAATKAPTAAPAWPGSRFPSTCGWMVLADTRSCSRSDRPSSRCSACASGRAVETEPGGEPASGGQRPAPETLPSTP